MSPRDAFALRQPSSVAIVAVYQLAAVLGVWLALEVWR